MWKTLHKFAYMSKKKQQKVFSETFKKSKVALIESGKMTISQVAKQFDVSYTAVYNWQNKYGSVIKPDKLVLETDSDYKKLIEVEKEKENLERVVGRQQIKIDYYEVLLAKLKEQYGDDLEKKILKK
jgi:transposase-like protein